MCCGARSASRTRCGSTTARSACASMTASCCAATACTAASTTAGCCNCSASGCRPRKRRLRWSRRRSPLAARTTRPRSSSTSSPFLPPTAPKSPASSRRCRSAPCRNPATSSMDSSLARCCLMDATAAFSTPGKANKPANRPSNSWSNFRAPTSPPRIPTSSRSRARRGSPRGCAAPSSAKSSSSRRRGKRGSTRSCPITTAARWNSA